MDLLVKTGCDTAQGYLVSVQALAEHFEAFVIDWQKRRPAAGSMA